MRTFTCKSDSFRFEAPIGFSEIGRINIFLPATMYAKSIVYLFIQCYLLCILSNAEPISGKGVMPAEENEFPFFVILSSSPNIDDHDDYFCGGTLITKKHVITSMHCIEDEDHNITLIVNAASQQNRIVHKIESWIAYDGWVFSQNYLIDDVDNDIAIITLSEEVKDAKPAILSKLKHDEVINQEVMAAGWGFIDKTNEVSPDKLMKAYMNVLNYTEFIKNAMAIYRRPSLYQPNFYYTSARRSVNSPAVIADGDCGGPLMLVSNKQVVGIHDGGCNIVASENNPNSISRHISLDYYRKFIESVITD